MNNTFLALVTLLGLSLLARVLVKTRAGKSLSSLADLAIIFGITLIDWKIALATWLGVNIVSAVIAVVYDLASDQVKSDEQFVFATLISRELMLGVFALLMLYMPLAFVWTYIGFMVGALVILMIWLVNQSIRARAIVACVTLAALVTTASVYHLNLMH
ncbi:MAG: hypothetical protein RSP_17650 [Rhodanobacter sp.]